VTLSSPHIFRRFDADLERIDAGAAELGGRTEALLAAALDAIARNDRRSQAGRERDVARIEALADRIERETAEVIALRQPVASDLRAVLCALKIAVALRRAGRMARGLDTPTARPGGAMRGAVLRLGQAAQAQLGDALTAWQRRDSAAAEAVRRRDAGLDRLCAAILTAAGHEMTAARDQIDPCSRWLLVARNLERIGDQAVEIANASLRRDAPGG
jgi:phosphate transport system protein